MSDDRENQNAAKTVPPPEGEEDAYNAATKVGKTSAELLAIVRAEMERQPSEPRMKTTDDDAPPISLTSMEVEDAPPPPRAKSIPPPVPKKSAPPPAPEPAATPAVPAKRVEEKRIEARPAVAPPPAGKGIAPAVGIVLVFVVAIALLAALVR